MAPQFTATNGLPAVGRAVHGAGDQLLADAALAGDQHGDGDLAARSPMRLTMVMAGEVADQVGEGGLAAGVLLQALDLALQVAHRQGVADRDDDAFREAGLMKKSLAPACMALTTVSTPPRGGQHDHRLVEAAGAHLLQGVLAAHAGHDQVEQDHVGGLRPRSAARWPYRRPRRGPRRSLRAPAPPGSGAAVSGRRRRRGPSWSLGTSTRTGQAHMEQGSCWFRVVQAPGKHRLSQTCREP
jgi:hypothetical protein